MKMPKYLYILFMLVSLNSCFVCDQERIEFKITEIKISSVQFQNDFFDDFNFVTDITERDTLNRNRAVLLMEIADFQQLNFPVNNGNSGFLTADCPEPFLFSNQQIREIIITSDQDLIIDENNTVSSGENLVNYFRVRFFAQNSVITIPNFIANDPRFFNVSDFIAFQFNLPNGVSTRQKFTVTLSLSDRSVLSAETQNLVTIL